MIKVLYAYLALPFVVVFVSAVIMCDNKEASTTLTKLIVTRLKMFCSRTSLFHYTVSLYFYRKNKQQIAILRIKTVELEHAGTYKCIAKNLVGEDMAKARLRGRFFLNCHAFCSSVSVTQ